MISISLILLNVQDNRVKAATIVSGDAYDGAGGGPWTLAQSPYIVVGDITVPAGQTLTINPGVVVKFDGYYFLYVEGNLDVTGTKTQRTNITSNSATPTSSDWGGVCINSTGHANINYCNVSYADSGIVLRSSYNNITQCNISVNWNGIDLLSASFNNMSGNNISFNDNNAFYLESSSNHNIICNNNITYNGNRGFYLKSWSSYNNIVANNISNNTYGLFLSSSTNNNITKNIISNYRHGIWAMSQSDHNKINKNNVSSCSESGIYLLSASDNTVIGNNFTNNQYGTFIETSWDNNITGNNYTTNYFGISLASSSNNNISENNITGSQAGIFLIKSSGTNISQNKVFSNNNLGIILSDSPDNDINDNNITDNYEGITLTISSNNTISGNTISSNIKRGISVGQYSSDNIFIDNTIISSNKTGAEFTYLSENNVLINCSISDSGSEDFYFDTNSHAITINTTFNGSKTNFSDTKSTLTVKWYLHVNIMDYSDNPVPNTNVKIEDNKNGSYNKTFITDTSGHLRWLTTTEYVEQDTNGDTVGEKTYHTPHKIVAWNDTLVGYAQPIMNESKNVTIVLFNGTLIDLKPGWNLVSLPRIQSDTNLPTVLQSIEDQYDAVQWYNKTDSNDPWKHNHISKPSNLNDLNEINNTMGLWVHVTDPGGTTLVVIGDEPSSDQNIPLFLGWNLVGYPSLTSYNRTKGLNNLTFGTHVDSIWTFDAANQKWEQLGESDYFIPGRGYWIFATTKCTWEVPL